MIKHLSRFLLWYSALRLSLILFLIHFLIILFYLYFYYFLPFQLKSNPSQVQDGIPDIYTLSLSSVKVGFHDIKEY